MIRLVFQKDHTGNKRKEPKQAQISAHLVSLCLVGIEFFLFVYNLKVCGNPVSGKCIGATFLNTYLPHVCVTFW